MYQEDVHSLDAVADGEEVGEDQSVSSKLEVANTPCTTKDEELGHGFEGQQPGILQSGDVHIYRSQSLPQEMNSQGQQNRVCNDNYTDWTKETPNSFMREPAV